MTLKITFPSKNEHRHTRGGAMVPVVGSGAEALLVILKTLGDSRGQLVNFSIPTCHEIGV
jgi:hypothetical protein